MKYNNGSGLSLESISQPPSNLEGCFPSLNRWETELDGLGKPGITSRVSAFSRMTAGDLLSRFQRITTQSEVLKASMAHITEENRLLGQEQSEISLVLSLLRTFEARRQPAEPVPSRDTTVSPYRSLALGDDELDSGSGVQPQEDG